MKFLNRNETSCFSFLTEMVHFLIALVKKYFWSPERAKSHFDYEKQGWVTAVGNLFHLLEK